MLTPFGISALDAWVCTTSACPYSMKLDRVSKTGRRALVIRRLLSNLWSTSAYWSPT